MKAAVCVICFLLCLLFWQTKSFRLIRRERSLKRIREFLLSVSDEIRWSRKNIFDIIASDKTGLGLFEGVGANGQLLSSYYLRAKAVNMPAYCLDGKDEAVIDAFFRDFGQGDGESQLRICAETSERLEERLRDAEDKRVRYCRLYTVTGVCSGLFCVIMLL